MAQEIKADVFTDTQIKMLRLLCDMAKDNIYPNGNFSDKECNIWSMFMECMRCNNGNHM